MSARARMTASRLVGLTLMALCLGGCGVLKIQQTPDEAYLQAKQSPPLKLPAGLRLPPPE